MGNTPTIFWLIPAAALIALLFAWYFFRQMKRQDEGTERMKEIARYVREGAMAYLRQQYIADTLMVNKRFSDRKGNSFFMEIKTSDCPKIAEATPL